MNLISFNSTGFRYTPNLEGVKTHRILALGPKNNLTNTSLAWNNISEKEKMSSALSEAFNKDRT